MWIEKLQQLLACPVCYETIRPPVDTCSNGHSVCAKCRRRLVHCPICSAEFTQSKNIMLGHIAEFVQYPCPNTIGGCTEVNNLRDEESHLKGCKFQVHQCKVDNCDWVGKRDELKQHVEDNHNEDIWRKDWSFAGSRKFDLADANDEFAKLLVIEDKLFWMLSNYDPLKKKVFKIFQYIASKDTKQKFKYMVSLKSSDNRRQVTFKKPVDDDSRCGSDIFESPNTTAIDYNILEFFSQNNEDKKPKYKYTITEST